MRRIEEWKRELVRLAKMLLNALQDTIDAWDRFQWKEIDYFLADDGVPTPLLKGSVNVVNTVFCDLKDIHRRL